MKRFIAIINKKKGIKVSCRQADDKVRPSWIIRLVHVTLLQRR